MRRIINSIVKSYCKPIDEFIENPIGTQESILRYLVEHGKNTSFGQEHNFDQIKNISDFQNNVPVHSYEDLRSYLDKILVEKKSNVLWDTPVKWFAMSSGTTEDKSKYIPVTQESLKNCHYRCGYYMLALYANHYPDSAYLLGKTLVLGGSQQINSIGEGIYTGDVSAILMKNLPYIVKRMRTPESIALITDWEVKLQKLTDYAVRKDIRSFVGVPSWMLVLLKKVVNDTQKTIPELWPNLEVFFHGGVSFTPYREQYEKIIPSEKMRYWETYNASEGFFGVQYSPYSKELLLLLDNEIFYEFIPSSEYNSQNPKVIPLSEVQVGEQYAMIISTSGGLWRYKIGDTVEFTSTNPYLFKISGRTKQFINAFGEEIIVDNADRSIDEACRQTGAKITEYTVAPIYFGDKNSGAHEWLIEFETVPSDLDLFVDVLDNTLQKVNSDYEAKRSYNLSLGKPVVRVIEEGGFYKWMQSRDMVGGQNKVPKLSNDRRYVDNICDFFNLKS